MKSITSDIKIYSSKLRKAAALKLRRRRESGCLPSFDWKKWIDSLPLLITVRSYQREFFASDLAAGLTEVCTAWLRTRRGMLRGRKRYLYDFGLAEVCMIPNLQRHAYGVVTSSRCAYGLEEVCLTR